MNTLGTSDLFFYMAMLFFVLGFAILGYFVILPMRRLVKQLEQFARGRPDLRSLKFRNEAELLGQVFRLLTGELRSKEDELKRLYEQADARARFMEHYSERLVESIPVGVVALTSQGDVATLNGSAERMFGKRAAEVSGRSHKILWGKDSRLSDLVEGTMASGTPLEETEAVWNGPDGKGEVRVYRIVGNILVGGEGSDAKTFVFTFYDLTPVRLLEEKVRTAGRLAAIGTLSAGLAHEIRNPFSAILGYADLLKKRTTDPELGELAATVENEARGLSRVVNEFLEFARKHERVSSLIRYQDSIEEVLSRLARTLRECGVTVHYGGFPETGICPLDKPSLQQLLYNLLLNAVEASPRGSSVELSYEMTPVEGKIRLIVQDRGCGIPVDQQTKIFDPFFTTKTGGTGLGLSIVHRITTAAGGEVFFESEVGKGTRFTALFPMPDREGMPDLGGKTDP